MKKRKLNEHGFFILTSLVLTIIINILSFFTEDGLYSGIVCTAILIFLPILSITFNKTINNLRTLPALLKVSKEHHKDRQEKVDKMLDCMESKKFSLSAPFIYLIANGIFAWIVIFARRFMTDNSFIFFSDWKISSVPKLDYVLYGIVLLILFLDACLIENKFRKIFSIICLIASAVFVFVNFQNGLSIYLTLYTIDVGYMFSEIKNKRIFEDENNDEVQKDINQIQTNAENAQVQDEEKKLDVFENTEDKTKE